MHLAHCSEELSAIVAYLIPFMTKVRVRVQLLGQWSQLTHCGYATSDRQKKLIFPCDSPQFVAHSVYLVYVERTSLKANIDR